MPTHRMLQLINLLRKVFNPPNFENDPLKTQTARLIFQILQTILIGLAIFILVLVIIQPNLFTFTLIALIPVLFGLAYLAHRGFVRLTSILLSLLLLLIIVIVAPFTGGVHSAAFGGVGVIVLIGGMLLGFRFGFGIALFSILGGLFLILLEYQKWLPEPITGDDSLSFLVSQGLYLVIIAVIVTFEKVHQSLSHQQLLEENAERRRSENALRISENRYREVVETQTDFIVRWIPDGTRTFVNQAYCRYFAGTDTQFIGTSFFELLDEKTVEQIRKHLSKLTPEKPTVTYEQYTKEIDGSYRWQQWADRGFFNETGELAEIQSVGRDITEQKRAEFALQESERRLLSLSEATFEGISISENGTVVDGNQQLAEILNCPLDEIVGTPISQFIHPDDKERVIQQILTGKETVYEHRVIRKGGETIFVEVRPRMMEIEGKKLRVTAIRDITERKKIEERIQHQFRNLVALREIDHAITKHTTLDKTLPVLLEQVTWRLGIDAANIMLYNGEDGTPNFGQGRGFLTPQPGKVALQVWPQLGAEVIAQNSPLQISLGSRVSPEHSTALSNWKADGFQYYLGTPLVVHGSPKGVLELYHRTNLSPDQEWFDFLDALVNQAAIAIDNATLFENLQQFNDELELAYDTTLEGWARALELRDQETEGHSRRVTRMTLYLAEAVGIEESELEHIRRGTLLHDIGKMGIPDAILQKPGPLSEEEWEIMRQHPLYAYNLLSAIPYLQPALAIPHLHHERWDGSGYPLGLKGEEIPLPARIFMVVDVWDALSSDRLYRKAWPKDKVLNYLKGNAGVLFDPQIVPVFVALLNKFDTKEIR